MRAAPRASFALTALAGLGYLLHLFDETRFGLGFELRFVVSTLGLLALALVGFALRPRYLAPLAPFCACLAGVLVAYLGGLGHLLPTPLGVLLPSGSYQGAGGLLLAINSAIGLSLAVVTARTRRDR